jgi:hypothetical protein
MEMKRQKKSIRHPVRICIALLAFFAARPLAFAQTLDFSGLWEQDNDRCQPKRSGAVTLHIEHADPRLVVETSISRGAESRHAKQEYTTDGKVSISTGADGDEFHTSVFWRGSSLVFSIEEHEDGRVLRSIETWSLLESGATLQRIRERADGEKQVLFFRRRQSAQAEQDRP